MGFVGAMAAMAVIFSAQAGAADAPPSAVKSVTLEPARLVHSESDELIDALHWEGEEFPVQEERDSKGEVYLVAVLEGRMTAPGWNLVSGKNWLVKAGASDDQFLVEVRLQGESTPLKLHAFNLSGEYEEESLDVRFESWGAWKQEVQERKRQEDLMKRDAEYWARLRHLYVSPMLGYSMISYSETRVPTYSTTALVPAINFQLLIVPNLSLSLSGFMNVLPISASRTDVTVNFYGLDGGLGWGIPIGSWRLNLLLGYYAKTMTVSGAASFGYRNMLGPQLFPTIEKTWAGKHTTSAYLKYAVVMDNFTSLLSPIGCREWAAGVGYRYRLSSGAEIPVTLDASWIHLELPRALVDNTTYTLNVGYMF